MNPIYRFRNSRSSLMLPKSKIKRWLLLPITGLLGIIATVVVVGNYAIRNQYPENVEFYVAVLGLKLRPVKKLAACTTAPWYGALDSAEFYAMALPDAAFRENMPGYPKKMDYQEHHNLVEWHNGPHNETDRPVLSQGLETVTRWLNQENFCSAKDRPLLMSISATLERTDIRLAYVYRNDRGNVNRLALYILDPTNRVFYLVRFGI